MISILWENKFCVLANDMFDMWLKIKTEISTLLNLPTPWGLAIIRPGAMWRVSVRCWMKRGEAGLIMPCNRCPSRCVLMRPGSPVNGPHCPMPLSRWHNAPLLGRAKKAIRSRLMSTTGQIWRYRSVKRAAIVWQCPRAAIEHMAIHVAGIIPGEIRALIMRL